MIDLYRRSIRYYWSTLPLLLGIMAFVGIVKWLLDTEKGTGSSGETVGQLFIIYMFHRHFLFGEGPRLWLKRQADAPPYRVGWFFLVALALVLIPLLLSFRFVSSVAPDDATRESKIFVGLILFAPLYLLSLSLFGTALPALVARSGNYRMTAGLRVCLGTMWRLILGPGVAAILIVVLIGGVYYLLEDNAAFDSTIGQIVAGAVFSTLGLFPSLLGVAVLCHMYEKITAAQAARAGQADTPG